ncbi:hypothetical protein ZWY2020_009071, partial [Hordeum vulgare]
SSRHCSAACHPHRAEPTKPPEPQSHPASLATPTPPPAGGGPPPSPRPSSSCFTIQSRRHRLCFLGRAELDFYYHSLDFGDPLPQECPPKMREKREGTISIIFPIIVLQLQSPLVRHRKGLEMRSHEAGLRPTYHHRSCIGPPSYTCHHCGVFFWWDEHVDKGSSWKNRHIIYNRCCSGGLKMLFGRKRKKIGDKIGRIYYVHPSSGELLVLHNMNRFSLVTLNHNFRVSTFCCRLQLHI